MSVAEQTAQHIPVGTWKSDPVHSTVAFAVKHQIVATFRGKFTDFEATLAGGEEPKLTGVVKVASIVVEDGNLYGHLLTPDFVDAERGPELRFESTSIRRDGDTFVADAELTVKGLTKPVTFKGTLAGPITDPWGGERLGHSLETTIDRTAYGIEWNTPLPGGGLAVSNDVALLAELELVKEQ
ncbi:MAG: YceI family protein [Gaiellaceae bacterium]